MSAVAFGVLAALCWGVSDWFARGLSRSLGALRAQVWTQLAGFVVIVVALALFGDVDAARAAPLQAWLLGVVYAALVGVAALCFFAAMARGRLVIVAPIVGGYGAVALMCAIANGLVPTPLQALGLAAAIAGAVLASVPAAVDVDADAADRKRDAVAAALAIAAALLFGTGFFALGFAAPALGGLVPALLSRTVGPGLLVLTWGVLRATKQTTSTLTPPPSSTWPRVVFSGALACLGAVVTAFGSRVAHAEIVGVLGSLSVVVTVLIGIVRLRERLARHQWAGVALALTSIPLLAG